MKAEVKSFLIIRDQKVITYVQFLEYIVTFHSVKLLYFSTENS